MIKLTRKEFETKTRDFVKGLNCIPYDVVNKLLQFNWEELTQCYVDDEDGCIYMPIWGTMFTFENEEDGIRFTEDEKIMKYLYEKGIVFYESETFGQIIFGINTAGLDFYKQCWEPMYKIWLESVWGDRVFID